MHNFCVTNHFNGLHPPDIVFISNPDVTACYQIHFDQKNIVLKVFEKNLMKISMSSSSSQRANQSQARPFLVHHSFPFYRMIFLLHPKEINELRIIFKFGAAFWRVQFLLGLKIKMFRYLKIQKLMATHL